MARTQMQIPYTRPLMPSFGTLAPDIERIIESGQLTKGTFLRQYEEALAQRLGVRNVVATSSCTTGLVLLYRALDITGAVIMPSYTFMATANALMWTGGTPIFVDVDPDTWTIDPERVQEALTPDVQAIVGVPIFGSPCDVERLRAIADQHSTTLVYDSAHGIGSSYDGRPLGGFGRAEVFSTTPTKTLVTGEGGFVTTNDDELAAELRMLIEYGNDGTFDTKTPGLNGRLAEIPALIGLRMLDTLDDLLARRTEIVRTYQTGFSDVEGVRMQHVRDGCVSSFKDFTVLIGDETQTTPDAVASTLAAEGVQTKRYFAPVVHRQGPYRSLGYDGKLPVTERLEAQALSLPISSAMTDAEVDYVIDAVTRAVSRPSR